VDITPGTLQALYTKYSQQFQAAFLKQEIMWPKIATQVSSDSESETHVFMDRIPQLRKWIGDRVVQNAVLRSYVVPNDAFELTMGLDRFKIEDNKLNAFEPTVRMMAEQSKKWPDTLFFDSVSGILATGATASQIATGYDGLPFFSTAHPVNMSDPASATQSNYSANGLALTPANYKTVRQTMRNYKGADGLPLKVNPNLLIVDPSNEAAGIQILKEEWIAPVGAVGAGAAGVLQRNPFFGTADLLVVDDLGGDAGTWYLCDTRSSIKPFIFQLRQAAKFAMLTDPKDPKNFQAHQFQYGVEVRGQAAFGPWFLAYKAKP
jgi:phage major head subunit gpT-like protein